MLPYDHSFPGENSVAEVGEVLDVEFSSTASSRRRSTQAVGLDETAIRRAYRAADGNLAAAARLLGVHRATLYRYLDRLGISRQDLNA
jgi:sigma-54 specific flagellar transcriptional regulator A